MNDLKKQDQQIDDLRKAEELAKAGNYEEALRIAEKSIAENGIIVRGNKWPFILSDIYLKNKMNDKCWRYLNQISTEFPYLQDKICEIRAKILKGEGKNLDALAQKMDSGLYKYSWQITKPEEGTLLKELRPYIKKANLLEKENDLLKLFYKYLPSIKYEPGVQIKFPDITTFRKELKETIK